MRFRLLFLPIKLPNRFIWLITLILGIMILQSGCQRREEMIVVGSKNFTEQIILGEMISLMIEDSMNLKVQRRLNLAGTFLCHQAVQSGEIDLYVEYSGTAYTGILELPPISDPGAVLEKVRKEYAERFDLIWTEPLGFNNTFAIMVRRSDAQRFSLSTISDVVPYAKQWQAGFGYEFLHRADGFEGLSKTYGLEFGKPAKEMDLGLMYRALTQGEVDLVAGNSTEGLVEVLDLAILEDDLGYFPPYQAAPVVNGGTLKRFPQLRELLRKLGGLISDQEMRHLNYQVDSENRNVKKVVADFLEKKQILSITE